MKIRLNSLWLTAFFALSALVPVEAQPAVFKVLHSFSADPNSANADGALPQGSLILSGQTVYGTALAGGKAGNGTVFAVNTNGSGFTNLHGFSATPHYSNSDGSSPQAALVLSGNTLYGTASEGGSRADGVLFAINTNGKGFTNLYSFTNGSDGYDPHGSLIVSGNTIYGMAAAGGSNGGGGTVFAVNTNGTGFRTVYGFTGGDDGSNPFGAVVLAGNTLYGMAAYGGSSGSGTVFAVNTDGSGFTNLYSFTAFPAPEYTNSDGAYPFGSLILAGNALYGMAADGGSAGYGTVFAVNTNGSGFTNLYSFTGGDDGANPVANLILASNTLYGTAEYGGDVDDGTLFAINTDGSGFTNLYSFTSVSGPDYTNTDGANPYAGLMLAGSTLYGAALYGGGGGSGTVFSLLLGPPVAPFVTTNPASQFVGAGSNVLLQAAAVGTNTLTYQWFFDGRKLTNGTHVSGATTDELILEGVAAANVGSYEVIVANSYGSATSAVATVTILAPPHITTQPVARIVATNGLATFSVKATGALLTYQWLFDGNIADSTTNVLTINPATAGNVGSYSVIVANAAAAVTSNPVRLTLVAEKTKPSVTITSPKANSRTNSPVLSGTASDSVGVEAVTYWVTNVNNGVITTTSGQAMLTAGSGSISYWTNSAAILLPGTNILTVQSSNYSGLASPVKSAVFFYIMPAMFTLTTNGHGKVTGSASVAKDIAPADGAMLNIGEGYTLTAHPSNNFLLSNWVSTTFTSNTPTLHFIMEPGLAISANFTTNLFAGMAGRYDGLFYPSEPLGVSEETSGLIENLRFGSNGVYSGKLYLAGTTHSLAGAFDSSGQASEPLGQIAAAGGSVTLQLTILFQSVPRQITGMVEGTNWTANNLNLYAATTNKNNASNYTVLLPQDPNLAGSAPPNYGYAFMTNTGSMINLGGELSDGTPFARSEPINEQNEFPVYANLYTRPGLLLGALSLDGDVPAGNLFWVKPAQKTGLYTNGFDTSFSVLGSPWTNSAAALTSLFPNDAQLTFSGDGLSSPLVCRVALTSNTLQRVSGSTNFTGGSINRANGQMTVTFINTSGKKVTASGAILQNISQGGGFFAGTTNAGTITLLPTNAIVPTPSAVPHS